MATRILALVLLCATLTACGGGGDDTPTPADKFIGPPNCEANPNVCY
jgi:hypothetical protein